MSRHRTPFCLSRNSARAALLVGLSCARLTALAAPVGGQVAGGTGSIASTGTTTTITQTSPTLSVNWQSFNIGTKETVNFVQPSASALAVNRIAGTSASQILGQLNANGQVYLINPNGIVFGASAQVNVGGLVASTLDLSDASLASSTRSFSGAGQGSVTNLGTITAADGGYVALLANQVSNQGTIVARLGTVALGAGSAVTLSFGGNNLLQMQVAQSTLNNQAQNGGLIQADGGTVLMSAGAQNAVLASLVNNTGVIEARTVQNHAGTITLLGSASAGEVNLAGTLDASAPNGGNGGAIETSAATVHVAAGTQVTTAAPQGQTGSWLIDPQDFTVAASGGDISGATLSASLGASNVTLQSSGGAAAGSGNINVNDAVSWNANTNLTLTAANNVNIGANLSASGNNAGLTINPNTATGTNSASGSGTFNLQNGAAVTLSGASPSLSIAGQNYIVINRLGAAGSTTGTDLQGIGGNLSNNYALGSNIDASATQNWNGGAGFTPIGMISSDGSNTAAYTGIFNGLGHTIANLTIDLPNNQNVALFGMSYGTVTNVGLVNSNISGFSVVAPLVASNHGTISNSYATGVVTDSGVGSFIGGLVGYNSNIIENSFTSGTLNTNSSYVGGITGYNAGSINNSYSTSSISGWTALGGLVGDNAGTVTNSYAAGYVPVGGGGLTGGGPGTVTNSFWDVTTSGQSSALGGGIGLSTADMQALSTYTTASAANGNVNPAWDFASVWTLYNGATYPLLRAFMTPLTVTANNASATAAGGYSGGNGVSFSGTPNPALLLGTLQYGGSSQGATAPGTYDIALSGWYSGQLGYLISYADGMLSLNAAPPVVAAPPVTATPSSLVATQAASTHATPGAVAGSDMLQQVQSQAPQFLPAAPPVAVVALPQGPADGSPWSGNATQPAVAGAPFSSQSTNLAPGSAQQVTLRVLNQGVNLPRNMLEAKE
jgi:filamentous hemagglutinin family protein